MNAKLNASPCTPQAARSGPVARARRRQPGALRPLALALASVSLLTPLWPGQARAQTPPVLPTGMTAVHGHASVAQRGAQMTVTNSAQAILNWQSFSIGAGAAVHFNQPHASSQVLNRVLGQDPSSIFGRLSSNGQVWLLNPHGVVFGPTARVDVAGLVASTLNLSDQDWTSGRAVLRPFGAGTPGLSGDAAVTNQGELRSASGGRIVLVGTGAARNEGLIEAPGGQVLLAAGDSVDLADTATPYIAMRVQAPRGEALNLGRIEAGSIDLQAALVNQQGLVRATSLTGQGGRVELRASDTLNLAAGSQTLVTGAAAAPAGTLVADAGRQGTLWVAGEVRADAASDSPQGTGGRVELLGRHIGVLNGAQVSASGSAGGGQVFVGGGFQGKDTSLPNAEAVYVAPEAQIAADATASGPGGRTIVWSNQATRAYGQFSARGGAQGGDGGFIETSGGWIDARPASIDATAPQGKAGEWLIDPNDLYIDGSDIDFNITGNPDFTTTGDFASIGVSTIRNALQSGNNVTLTTSAIGGDQPGDIFMSFATLDVVLSQPVSLTFNAQRNIEFIQATISSASSPQPLSVVFNPALGGGLEESIGTISLVNSTIDVPGGSISMLGANAYDSRPVGVRLSASNLSAPGGSITIAGRSIGVAPFEASYTAGVGVEGLSTLQAKDITISGLFGGEANLLRAGVYLNNATLTATETLTITGTATSAVAVPEPGFDNSPNGVYAVASTLSVAPGSGDPAGQLLLFGTVAEGTDPGEGSFFERYGFFMSGGVLNLTAGSELLVQGTASGPYTTSLGLFPDRIDASTGGGIDILGTTGAQVFAEMSLPTGAAVSVQGLDYLDFRSFGSSSGSPSNLSLEGGARLDVGGLLTLTGDSVVFMFADAIYIGDDLFESTFNLNTGGRIDIEGLSTTISAFSSLTSSAPGDAIVVAAQGVGAVFDNLSSTSNLITPQGRWIVLATDPTDSFAFNPGGLVHDFTQYNADTGSFPLGTGNGFLFSVAPVLEQTGGTFAKVYDGNTELIAPPDISVSGLLLDAVIVGSYSFVAPNAGTAQPVQLGSLFDPGVTDSLDRPVYGYQLGSTFVGTITPAALTLSGVLVAARPYDGSTLASVSGGSLSGLIGMDDLVFSLGVANFADADAGPGKLVTGTATLADGSLGLASNYSLAGFSTTGTVSLRPLTVVDVVAQNKVYDANNIAFVSGGVFSGLVSGEDLALSLGSASFDTANAGVDKTVSGSVGLADGEIGLASNYTLAAPTFTALADITPAPLTVAGLVASDKIYDGSTAATVTGGVLSGLVSGEDLALSLGSASFDTANVGVDKTVSGSAVLADGSNGLASNYSLTGGAFTALADITPAVLSFVADAAQSVVGAPLPPLTGTVTGLVAGETLAGATTGTLLFSSPATPESPPGNYPVFGSGLLAGNYVFEQAAQNATALQQLPASVLPPEEPPPPVQPPEVPTDTEQQFAAIQPTLFPPVPATTPGAGRVLDAVQAVSPQLGAPGVATGQPSFRRIARASLSQNELAALLAARDQFKKELFAEALDRLAQDPTLADAPPCTTLQQAATGACLMTEPVRELARAQMAQLGTLARAAPTTPAAPVPLAPGAADPPGPAPAPAVPPPPAQAAASPAAPAAAAEPGAGAAVAAATPEASPLPGILDPVMPPQRRAVRLAVLPEIQRKVAVLIGNDRYTDTRIPSLDNAANDARAVGNTLQTALGYETLVLENASRAEILRTLNRLALQLEPQDSLIIYYAGHGEVVEATGQGYWQPADAVATDPSTWISNNDIGRLLAQFAPNQVALVSDSCFSGSLVGDERIRGININSDPQQLLQRRAAVVMTSGGNEPVFDAGRNGHSPFAWSLMRAIEQVPNWRPGSNVFERVRFNVARELPQRPQYGSSRVGGHVAGADYLFEQRQLEGPN